MSFNMLSLILYYVAPGPVRSLTAEFGTNDNFDTATQTYNITLTISFSPPAFLNGILDKYNVSVEGN